MPKNSAKRGPAPKRQANAGRPAKAAAPQSTPPPEPPQAAEGGLGTLKDNIKRLDKGNLFEALKRVKEMKPTEWRDPAKVKELTEGVAQDIGLRIDQRRMDAFLNAFTDATKNAGEKGPNVSVEDIARKYGGASVDDKTIKELKKFVK